MSAEIEGIQPSSEPAKPGKRCKFCARLLVKSATEPDEAKPHCDCKGCFWCVECRNGQTSVSPVQGTGEAA